MRRASVAVALVGVGLLSLFGCRDKLLSPTAPPSDASAQLLDGAHGGGNSHFFFLPPLVADPSKTPGFDAGQFDATLSPAVQICVVSGGGCALLQPSGFPIEFTTDGHGSEQVRVDPTSESYIVNWKTKDAHLSSALTYRLRVLVAGTELGHADVAVVNSGSELKNVDTNQFVALNNGSTLPIKFRIEKGAVFVVDEHGGTVVAEGGTVTITLPPRPAPIGVTVDPASNYPTDSRLLAGTPFDLGPAGTTFAPPATISIKYDPSTLPNGKYPRIHKVVNGVWTPISGSTADLVNHVVTAPVTGFSTWGVLGTGVVLTVHVTGGTGQVSVEGGDPPDPCTYLSSTCSTDFTAGTSIALIASTIGPDARFENWSSASAGVACTTDPRCPFAMDQDRDVTARFSMPGILTVDRTTASFSMTRGGTLPTPQTASATNIGGRSLTLALPTVTYSPTVTPWLDAQLSSTAIDPSGPPATLTMSVLSNTLFPGIYNATVVVRDAGGQTPRTIAVALTVNAVGASVSVNGTGRNFGPLPTMTFAFADDATGNDIYPLGTGAYYLFGLFDTGSTKTRVNGVQPYFFTNFPDPNGGLVCNDPNLITDGNFFNTDAATLGLTAPATARVRLNGLSAIDPVTLGAPIGSGLAQVEVPGITITPQTGPPNPNVTLIGTPIPQQIVTALDYRTSVTRSGYDFYPGLTSAANSGIPGFVKQTSVTGPNITFYPSGSPSIPSTSFELDLGLFGLPVRPILKNVAFRHQGHYIADVDAPTTSPLFYLFDTGTTPTIIGDRIAQALGLTAGAGTFSCLSGTNNGYVIDSFIAVGASGTYTVNGASICWSQVDLQSVVLSAVIGSNLFDQALVVLDGPRNKLGIGPITTTPVTWTKPRNNCAPGGGGGGGGPTIAVIFVSLDDNGLSVGQTTQAHATTIDVSGNNVSVPVIWTSSNINVARVSASGVVTAVASGTADITATVGAIQGKASVTVGFEVDGRQLRTLRQR